MVLIEILVNFVEKGSEWRKRGKYYDDRKGTSFMANEETTKNNRRGESKSLHR